MRQERLGLAEEADREQLRGEVAVDPRPAEGMAVESAALRPAESASHRLSESLKRKADPIDHSPDDPRLDLPGGDGEIITTIADDSASSQMMTQESASIAPAGAESSHAADAGLGRRRTVPPHAATASGSVPPLASTAGSAAAAAPSASSGSRASDNDAEMHLQTVERELGAMGRALGALAHLGLEDLNSIVEVYGPGRIVDTGVQVGLTSGQAFDLRMNDPDDGKPWDLSLESKRHKVWWAIEDQGPYLLVGSPPCDPFSNLHNLSIGREDPTKRAEKIRRGIIHLSFCFALYRHRAANGRYFLREHPWSACSMELEVGLNPRFHAAHRCVSWPGRPMPIRAVEYRRIWTGFSPEADRMAQQFSPHIRARSSTMR